MAGSDLEERLASKTFAVFDGTGGDSLGEVCRRLLSEQKNTWADCRRGYDSLATVEERSLECGGFSVIIQHNPGRATSTEARVGEKDIACRPCFLCPDRLPEEQKLVRYGTGYGILCNPMPVFPEHFTIACLGHEPQAIGESLDTFMRLVDDFGDDWVVLYNGPRCGASAPDHRHFQAITGGRSPIESEVFEGERWEPVRTDGPVRILRGRGLARETVVMEALRTVELKPVFRSYLEALARVHPSLEGGFAEPMINLAGFRRRGVARLIVFPRRAHRPSAFFLEGKERIAVSPAIAEMTGILVAPVRSDYLRLTARMVRDIYREVSLEEGSAERVMEDFARTI